MPIPAAVAAREEANNVSVTAFIMYICAVQVWRYKRTLGACLPDYSAIKTLYPRDFASALGPLVAYKDRMGDCSHLSDEERERVHSTDWMDDAEERIEDIVFERCAASGSLPLAQASACMEHGVVMCSMRSLSLAAQWKLH